MGSWKMGCELKGEGPPAQTYPPRSCHATAEELATHLSLICLANASS